MIAGQDANFPTSDRVSTSFLSECRARLDAPAGSFRWEYSSEPIELRELNELSGKQLESTVPEMNSYNFAVELRLNLVLRESVPTSVGA